MGCATFSHHKTNAFCITEIRMIQRELPRCPFTTYRNVLPQCACSFCKFKGLSAAGAQTLRTHCVFLNASARLGVRLGKYSTFGAGERLRTLWHYEYTAFGICVFETHRISSRSRKHVRLALRQIIENVWHCTRNCFSAQKSKPPEKT